MRPSVRKSSQVSTFIPFILKKIKGHIAIEDRSDVSQLGNFEICANRKAFISQNAELIKQLFEYYHVFITKENPWDNSFTAEQNFLSYYKKFSEFATLYEINIHNFPSTLSKKESKLLRKFSERIQKIFILYILKAISITFTILNSELYMADDGDKTVKTFIEKLLKINSIEAIICYISWKYHSVIHHTNDTKFLFASYIKRLRKVLYFLGSYEKEPITSILKNYQQYLIKSFEILMRNVGELNEVDEKLYLLLKTTNSTICNFIPNGIPVDKNFKANAISQLARSTYIQMRNEIENTFEGKESSVIPSMPNFPIDEVNQTNLKDQLIALVTGKKNSISSGSSDSSQKSADGQDEDKAEDKAPEKEKEQAAVSNDILDHIKSGPDNPFGMSMLFENEVTLMGSSKEDKSFVEKYFGASIKEKHGSSKDEIKRIMSEMN